MGGTHPSTSAPPAALAIDGWMSPAQLRVLHDRAHLVAPGSTIVEIGSYRGRSTVALATGAPETAVVVAIDPHAGNDRGPRQLDGFAAEAAEDRTALATNLRAAGVAGKVRHVPLPSAHALGEVDGEIALLHVDGAHRYAAARADLHDWVRRIQPGGTLLVHDAFSSVGVTLALVRELLTRRDWTYLGRTGSLAEYRRQPPTRARNVARQLAELPWFARNLVVKLALVLRLRSVARLLGHDPAEPWPY